MEGRWRPDEPFTPFPRSSASTAATAALVAALVALGWTAAPSRSTCFEASVAGSVAKESSDQSLGGGRGLAQGEEAGVGGADPTDRSFEQWVRRNRSDKPIVNLPSGSEVSGLMGGSTLVKARARGQISAGADLDRGGGVREASEEAQASVQIIKRFQALEVCVHVQPSELSDSVKARVTGRREVVRSSHDRHRYSEIFK